MSWRPKRRIYDGNKTVWVARYADQQGRVQIAKPVWNHHKGTFALKREAQRAIDEALAAGPAPERASTVGGYLTVWLESRPRSERTDTTNLSRIRAVSRLELEGVRLEDWDMRDLKRRHRDLLVARMLVDQGRSPGGARNILRSLSAMFEDAITDELADVNPWAGARIREDDRRASKRSREPRTWTWDQMHSVARSSGRHEPMIRAMSDCGLRIGELFALKRTDLTGNVLTVAGTAWEGRVTGSTDTKNHARTVPIPPELQQMLRDLPTRIDVPWLFPTASGTVWRYNNWRRQVWNPATERAGIDATPHEFRHSYISLLRAEGVDPADLAEIAGHSVQTATTRYTHALGRSHDQIRGVVG